MENKIDYESIYDLPIEAFIIGDFWETTNDTFLLSFGRMMKKYSLGLVMFDVLIQEYNILKPSDIDLFIENYLKEHSEDFMTNEVGSLIPIMMNGLYYSKHWGDYV